MKIERLEEVNNEIAWLDKQVSRLNNMAYRGEKFEEHRELRVNELMDNRDILVVEKIKLERLI